MNGDSATVEFGSTRLRNMYTFLCSLDRQALSPCEYVQMIVRKEELLCLGN